MFALWKPAFVRAAGQAKLGFSGLDPLVSAQGVSSDCSTWDIWGISVFVLIDLSLHTLSQRQNNEDFSSLFVSNFITLQPGHSVKDCSGTTLTPTPLGPRGMYQALTQWVMTILVSQKT